MEHLSDRDKQKSLICGIHSWFNLREIEIVGGHHISPRIFIILIIIPTSFSGHKEWNLFWNGAAFPSSRFVYLQRKVQYCVFIFVISHRRELICFGYLTVTTCPRKQNINVNVKNNNNKCWPLSGDDRRVRCRHWPQRTASVYWWRQVWLC